MSDDRVTARSLAFDTLRQRACQRILVVGFEEPMDLACVSELVAPSGLAVGLDLSDEAVFDAAARAQGPTWAATVAAPTILPFAPESFDALLTTYSPRLLPEKLAAGLLAGFSRVLEAGGLLVLLHRSRRWPAKDADGVSRGGRILPDGLTEAALEEAGFVDLVWKEAPSPFILTGIVLASRGGAQEPKSSSSERMR